MRLKDFVKRLVCCVVVLASAPVYAATIVVDVGGYASAEEAGRAEEGVNWSDDDSRDDTICTQAFAATELQHYLRKMIGREEDFVIVDDAAAATGDVILVGGPGSNAAAARLEDALGVTPADVKKLGPEGYILKTVELEGAQIMLVAGGGRVGALYGAYDLLHRLGVRWYAPGEINEEVPQEPLARLPDVNVEESPKFFTRGFHAWENRGDPDFLLWMARNRLNYWCVQQEQKALLHKLGIMLVGGAHVLTPYYLGPQAAYPYDHPRFDGDDDKPEDPYPVSEACQGDLDGNGQLTNFEAHPEWYGLRGGKRSDRIHGDGGDNFCTSNMDAMHEWTKNAVEDLVDGRYKDATIMNAWALDGGKWCECEHCKALGSPTDRNILLVYHYAQAIKQAQAEGLINRPVRLLFLAYADVLEPPTRPLPDDFDYDMCIATYFPIVRCYVYNFDDPACSRNANYNKHLLGWAVDPDRHYKGQICIGEYYNVSGYKCLPICYMHTMENDIPYYYSAGARHFHYMHCTTKNWGNKALTNWQMARQLWEPGVDCAALWKDYFGGRYGPAKEPMRRFYAALEKMFCNVSEMKYGLARRLDRGVENLFPNNRLKYEKTAFDEDDGPDLVEILAYGAQCREIIDGVLGTALPERIKARVAEDERMFTYGERTVQFFDALCRTYALVRAGKQAEAREPFKQAQDLAAVLKADTASTQFSSSHASAPDALTATYAAGALAILTDLVAPPNPEDAKHFDPAAGALKLTGKEFHGGGALRYGYGLYGYPGRIRVSEVGNYIYGAGTRPFDRIHAWFRLDTVPEKGLSVYVLGLKCPEPAGGDIKGEIRVNDGPVFTENVPFSEKELTGHTVALPAKVLKEGLNTIEIRNLQPNGKVGNRPWFGVDHIELRACPAG